MNTKKKILTFGLICVLSAVGINCGSEKVQRPPEGSPAVTAASQDWKDQFQVSAKHLIAEGKNPFFILEPGYQLVLTGDDEGAAFELTITALKETKTVAGFSTRVVEERETRGGQLVEVSRNYFAIDRNTKDVFYFGEDVDDYKDGKVTGHAGSWMAGQSGAKFGLVMPGAPKVGYRYYQEQAPGTAMDRAEIISLNETVQTPAGTFTNCLKTMEGSALKPDKREYKFYAPGIGLIQESDLLLAKYGNSTP